ncbi:selenobiotic family peptide radical SAM maturase [Dissulfurirhabdus thermomarina]|uniref:Selenobiotic family peptide radical SAM maturase n=2 Tax=Dissulfurirhabdus thermomarina TaxID=1765737 RepID=A0A6N9TKE6_DISTH|nr:thio(seleno)oxazole modification radical SAM maturase SbtM [Dissulfurirhabdus thermomarina]NDY41741.1 selenobiotic family peptide radical SAM maturase [Dissulfurirhabdus thermomarina]
MQGSAPAAHPAGECAYPLTRRLLAEAGRSDIPASPELPERLEGAAVPPWLPDLARVERAAAAAARAPRPERPGAGPPVVNPTLELVRLAWPVLDGLDGELGAAPPAAFSAPPAPADGFVLCWQDTAGVSHAAPAAPGDLLALKVVVEGLDPEAVASAHGVPVGRVDEAIRAAADREILLAPPSRIRRDPAVFPIPEGTPDHMVTAETFAVQWHVTQACDLHCRHCYDRSDRAPLSYEQGVRVLDDLRRFCQARNVRGHVVFTGGNPFLHPRFADLYRAAADRGFSLAILGNPVPRRRLEEILAIREPTFYQVSLEGLEPHNDFIRGRGHFRRALAFLDLLRELGVSSSVMLTLTRENLPQVLPLAEILRGRADGFTFNRLSPVGEGARLALPDRDAFLAFLEAFRRAAARNEVLYFKDNLLNALLHREGLPLSDGCTGYGCGAAFNFIALLPDGEAHACRKFPSPIGNVHAEGLEAVYESAAARRYRAGCEGCRPCPIRPWCGGCLAVARGLGRDIFTEPDPFCPFLGTDGIDVSCTAGVVSAPAQT